MLANNYAIQISEDDFEVGKEYQALCDQAPKSGAVVFFVGLVRDFYDADSAERVEHIELQH